MSKYIKTVTRQVVDAEIDWKGIAAAVDALVMDHHHKMMQEWKDDRNLRIMYTNDATNSLDVCNQLAKGDWNRARAALSNMDTAARDLVYDLIEQVAGKEFFDHVR
jgi:hypothetical protein